MLEEIIKWIVLIACILVGWGIVNLVEKIWRNK